MEEKSKSPENKTRYWLQMLRPLGWWLLLVLVLYGIRTHQRLMEKTRLAFNVTLAGQVVYPTPVATFDGQPIASGQNISLGRHEFEIRHSKGDTFTTNFFIWYGPHDLGTIDLRRAMGTLTITANPPAPFLSIHGPEWSAVLTNSSGLSTNVPTDLYEVETRYAHWERTDEVAVFADTNAIWQIIPQLGAVNLSCNQPDTTFQLLAPDDRLVESGSLPILILELPAGDYKLMALHHGDKRDLPVAVATGQTNDVSIEYKYGMALLETEPSGAAVVDDSGRNYGVTPITFPELAPGPRRWTLHLAGYEAVVVSLEINANQTATFDTNLISLGYTGAMKTARDSMAQAEYGQAFQACNDALVAKPDDAGALALSHEAKGAGLLQQAKALGDGGDYIAAGKDLTLALEQMPDNQEIKTLITQFKQREPEQIERERVKRMNHPRAVFDEIMAQHKDTGLFEDHEITTSKPAGEAASAIAQALLAAQPAFKIDVNKSLDPDSFEIVCRQDVSGGLIAAGFRRCIIVCGQASDAQTQIYFKVVEYKTKHNVSMPGLLAFKDQQEFIPISPSRIPEMSDKLKAQIQTGVSDMTARIQGVVGP